MSRRSSLRSAVIVRWPVSLNVTLTIDPRSIAGGDTVGIVGLRLVHMGGKFVAWQPNSGRGPAVARFEFLSIDERQQFIARALDIPGVSIAASA